VIESLLVPAVDEVVAELIVVAGCAVVETTVVRGLPTVGKERVPKLAIEGTVRVGDTVFSLCVVVGTTAATEGGCVPVEGRPPGRRLTLRCESVGSKQD